MKNLIFIFFFVVQMPETNHAGIDMIFTSEYEVKIESSPKRMRS